MARAKKQSGVASLNPDNMASAGLGDDFDGEIVKARFVPWNYNGNREEYSLAMMVEFEPDDESGVEAFTEYYSSGDLQYFLPSEDGEEPIDFDGWDQEDLTEVEGPFAKKVGKRDSLNNNTNMAHFMRSLVDSGSGVALEADLRVMEGIKGHFNRVPQQKRSGIINTEDEESGGFQRTILLMTEFESDPSSKPAKGRKKAASKAAAASKSADVDEDLSDDVSVAILEAVSGAGGDGLAKRKLPGVIVQACKGDKRKRDAVKLASDLAFLGGSDLWDYDADEAVLTEA